MNTKIACLPRVAPSLEIPYSNIARGPSRRPLSSQVCCVQIRATRNVANGRSSCLPRFRADTRRPTRYAEARTSLQSLQRHGLHGTIAILSGPIQEEIGVLFKKVSSSHRARGGRYKISASLRTARRCYSSCCAALASTRTRAGLELSVSSAFDAITAFQVLEPVIAAMMGFRISATFQRECSGES